MAPFDTARSFPGFPREFASTHWSVVIQAGDHGSPRRAAALEALCRDYWYPLYAFVRRSGRDPESAADLTQEFFSRLLAGDGLATVSRSKGRFRSFLVASIRNLMSNERDRSRCLKRGGGAPCFSIDEATAEGMFRGEPADTASPDLLFDRRWAEAILGRSLARLRQECDDGGGLRRFEEVKSFLLGEKAGDTVAAAAVRLGMGLPATKALIHRLRRRFAELIRTEVAQTLAQPTAGAVEEEIRELLAAFGDASPAVPVNSRIESGPML